LTEESLDCLGIQRKFKPRWGRTVAVDATYHGQWAIYAAFDEATLDPVCYTVYTAESETNWLRFFKLIDATGYRVEFIVSDKGPRRCLVFAIQHHFTGLPHQLDWVHEKRDIDEILPLPELHKTEASRKLLKRPLPTEQEQKLCNLVCRLENSSREDEFDLYWNRIKGLQGETTDRGRQVIDMLKLDLSLLRTRLIVGKSTATSNLAEFSFGRFKRLFLNRIGLHAITLCDARKQVNRLFAAYRVRIMDRSEDLYRVGKTTLELAGTDAIAADIWQFIRANKRSKARITAQ